MGCSERPKPKFLAETETVSVILTETTDLPIFEHFVGEMDLRKREKINFCLVFNILI